LPSHRVLIEKRAQTQLSKLDEETRSRILTALHILRDTGFSSELGLRKLRGYKNHYRLRVGKYRVLFELQPEKTTIIYAILPRKRAY
jgi:mRNA interferase RelE/StbE